MSFIRRIILLLCFVQVCPDRFQVTTEEGQNALLQCIYTGSDLTPDPTVTWTDPDEKNVFTLIQRKVKYRLGMVGIFEDQYSSSGNFSIQILKVTKQQEGIYQCSIEEVDYRNRVVLSVTDKSSKTEGGPLGGAAVLHHSWSTFVLVSAALFIV